MDKLIIALSVFITLMIIDPTASNDPRLTEPLELVFECEKSFNEFLPPCNPCFEPTCARCTSPAAQASCKLASSKARENETCLLDVSDRVQKFMTTDFGKKCAFLEAPRISTTRTNPSARTSQSDWMARVPDDQSLAYMTIPGTHQSCARYGGVFSKCQTMSLTDQLMSGIRFLDIRARVHDGIFTIHHDFVYQKMVFGGVLDECIEFLNNHPNETILMKIKQEYSKASDSEFIAIFDKYRKEKGYKNVPYGDRMHIDYRIPTLKQVRGKIVIISQVHGLPGIQWPSVQVQDDYWVSTIGQIPDKWKKVRSHLEKAALEHDQGRKDLFANFANGASSGFGLAFPHVIAKSVNRDLYSYLSSEKCQQCYYGIVAMDFPGYYDSGVIDQLIRYNKNR